jgi:hypothetical protein
MRGDSFRYGACSVAAIATVWLMPRCAMGAHPPESPDLAAAAPASVSPWRKPFAIEGHVGLGTPLGLIGVALDMTPMPWVSFNLGLGEGVDGTQYEAMARVRVAPAAVTGGIGAGASSGKYASNSDSCWWSCAAIERFPYTYREWNTAVWGNAEAFVEGRSGSGFQWRVYVGIGRLMNASASTCSFGPLGSPKPSACDAPMATGYVGTALGYAFSL